jgi:hypothetical protein
MAAKETAAQRRTRIGLLLAEYNNVTSQLNKLNSQAKSLKEQIRDVTAGSYGDWQLTFGTPRQVLDQKQVKIDYAELGKQLPMVDTSPPISVTAKV